MTTSKIYHLAILDIFNNNSAAIIGTLYKWKEVLSFYVNSLGHIATRWKPRTR